MKSSGGAIDEQWHRHIAYENHMTTTAVRIAAGIGKTTECARLLNNFHGSVEIYAPNHELAKDWEELLFQYAPTKRVQIIYGRGQKANDGDFYCQKHKLAEDLAKAGCSVFPNLCQQNRGQGQPPVRCEYYETCAYIRQFEYAEIRIYVHAHLGRERSRLEQFTPVLVIIDESFWKDCIQPLTFSIDFLRHPDLPDASKNLCLQIAEAFADSPHAIAEIVRTAEADGTLLSAIRALRKAGTIMSPDMDTRQIRKRLKVVVPFHKIATMLQQLHVESFYGRPIQSVTFDIDVREVTVHHRMPITRFSSRGLRRLLGPTAKILLLDASADRLIIEQFFDIDAFEDISVERNAHVTQCYSTACSTTRLVPSRHTDDQSRANAERDLAAVQEIIDRFAENHQKILVVGPAAITGNENKGVPALLKAPKNVDFAHFGAIRGIDKYKHHDAVIIIGRNQPPVEAIEDYGRALYYDHPEPLKLDGKLELQERGYNFRHGKRGGNVSVCPDDRLQAIMEQLRERESEQALDRLRLVHHQGAPKEVLLLSNLPLDIDVDELRSTREIAQGGNRIEQAFAKQDDGALPLRPEWLAANCPDLWPTAEAAKKDIARKKGQTPNINIIREMSLFEYEYKTAGQRRWSRCLSSSPAPENVAEKLTIKLGETVTARWVATPRAG